MPHHHHTIPRRRRRLSACGESLQAVTFSLPADMAAYEQLGEGSAGAAIRKMLRMYERTPAGAPSADPTAHGGGDTPSER